MPVTPRRGRRQSPRRRTECAQPALATSPLSGSSDTARRSASSIDTVEETLTAGGSSLSYDAGTDTYTYVWKTSKNWSDTCRQLVVKLADGTEHVANFE